VTYRVTSFAAKPYATPCHPSAPPLVHLPVQLPSRLVTLHLNRSGGHTMQEASQQFSDSLVAWAHGHETDVVSANVMVKPKWP
jgi:hypothetical protein